MMKSFAIFLADVTGSRFPLRFLSGVRRTRIPDNVHAVFCKRWTKKDSAEVLSGLARVPDALIVSVMENYFIRNCKEKSALTRNEMLRNFSDCLMDDLENNRGEVTVFAAGIGDAIERVPEIDIVRD